jgi:hypothetical protein
LDAILVTDHALAIEVEACRLEAERRFDDGREPSRPVRATTDVNARLIAGRLPHYQPCLISWTHKTLIGGLAARVGRAGSMNPGAAMTRYELFQRTAAA